ncbi:MAG TPA: RNA polymerase sigma factor, partial [Chloroflexota bacterium]|nr:RNA polymerase sigma factor [Chloroflexota bacterium]
MRGDGDAFAALFDRHAPRVFALAYQLLGDRAEAEDITQDAFLQALSALPTLRQPETFGAWVARIATNASLSTLRRRGRLPQAELSEAVTATYPDPARWSSPEAMGLATEERHSVHVTLKRLAPSHRAALAMREIGGLSYAEIARALGTTAGGVEALLFRARARFRDEYHKVALGAATAQTTTCTCQQAQEALAALADNALAEPRRMEVVSHVRHCDACTATLQAQRDARRLIVAVPLFVPSAIKLATMAKVGPLLSLYAIGGAAAGGAATAGMATGGAATAGMATSGAATAGMAAGGAASSGAAVAGGAVAGGAAATGVAATSSVAAGGTAAGAIATGGVAASAAAVSTGVAGAASTAGTSALIPVLAGVGTAGPAAKVAAVLVVGAIVAGVVTEPHRGRVAAPHAHRPLVGRPSVAQGTPTPPPPSSVRYAATGATVLVGPRNVPQGLVSPTVVSWPNRGAWRSCRTCVGATHVRPRYRHSA